MTRSPRFIGLIITLMVPLVILMTAVRVMLSPLYLEIEYRAPGFPPDPYGFTLSERLKWSKVSLNYLTNNEGIEYLSSQKLSDTQSLYNPSELSHMVDVKNVIKGMIKGWYLLLIGLTGLGFWAWRRSWVSDFRLYLTRGAWLTIIMILTIIIFIIISFNALFTAFHRIFFTGDSWIFLYSDTLIRLFPLRLWQDAFAITGVFTLIGSFALILLVKKLGK